MFHYGATETVRVPLHSIVPHIVHCSATFAELDTVRFPYVIALFQGVGPNTFGPEVDKSRVKTSDLSNPIHHKSFLFHGVFVVAVEGGLANMADFLDNIFAYSVGRYSKRSRFAFPAVIPLLDFGFLFTGILLTRGLSFTALRTLSLRARACRNTSRRVVRPLLRVSSRRDASRRLIRLRFRWFPV